MSEVQESPFFEDLQKPKELAAKHSHILNEWTVRKQCRESEHNGLAAAGAVYRFGNRYWIHEPKYMEWFKQRHAV